MLTMYSLSFLGEYSPCEDGLSKSKSPTTKESVTSVVLPGSQIMNYISLYLRQYGIQYIQGCYSSYFCRISYILKTLISI